MDSPFPRIHKTMRMQIQDPEESWDLAGKCWRGWNEQSLQQLVPRFLGSRSFWERWKFPDQRGAGSQPGGLLIPRFLGSCSFWGRWKSLESGKSLNLRGSGIPGFGLFPPKVGLFQSSAPTSSVAEASHARKTLQSQKNGNESHLFPIFL